MDEDLVQGSSIRHAGRAALAAALQASRRDMLATFDAYRRAGALQVPERETLNPPLWELGHIGWFQEFWIGRNPQRALGSAADPLAPRAPGVRAGADALYNASEVPHARRWQLPLPDADATQADLAGQLERTLALLQQAEGDDALYFFRLALLHEDMHHEAAIYMARALGVELADARWRASIDGGSRSELRLPAGRWRLGVEGGGFAFDNERGAHDVDVAAFAIDRRAVNWAEFLAFVDAGGYSDDRWWTDAGRRWRDTHGVNGPKALQHGTLEPLAAAEQLSLFEAEAWCAWAGRRLPIEAEWERAALSSPDAFAWGQVWEWTASAFAPYPGFAPHPYRDYSAPWFDGRPVLRGASWATQPRMRNARYRNFFRPDRVDIIAGFRTCAL